MQCNAVDGFNGSSEGGERETREILLDLMLIRLQNSLYISPCTTSKILCPDEHFAQNQNIVPLGRMTKRKQSECEMLQHEITLSPI